MLQNVTLTAFLDYLLSVSNKKWGGRDGIERDLMNYINNKSTINQQLISLSTLSAERKSKFSNFNFLNVSFKIIRIKTSCHLGECNKTRLKFIGNRNKYTNNVPNCPVN